MIRITRLDLPSAVTQRMTGLTEEIAATTVSKRAQFARTKWNHTTIRRHVHSALRATLGEMAPGRERCMYCGDNQGSDIDHHEPIARNPVRAFDWLNHLLACSICNSHHLGDRYPCDSEGRALLLDPSIEDPFEHLFLTLKMGVYRHLTPKGEATIDLCQLNRPILTIGRQRAFHTVGALLRNWQRANVENDTSAMREFAEIIREHPFAEVCQSMLRQAAGPDANLVFGKQPDLLDLLLRPDLRAALVR